jgi:hypothetical protein
VTGADHRICMFVSYGHNAHKLRSSRPGSMECRLGAVYETTLELCFSRSYYGKVGIDKCILRFMVIKEIVTYVKQVSQRGCELRFFFVISLSLACLNCGSSPPLLAFMAS